MTVIKQTDNEYLFLFSDNEADLLDQLSSKFNTTGHVLLRRLLRIGVSLVQVISRELL